MTLPRGNQRALSLRLKVLASLGAQPIQGKRPWRSAEKLVRMVPKVCLDLFGGEAFLRCSACCCHVATGPKLANAISAEKNGE